jgi:hypothetical protein
MLGSASHQARRDEEHDVVDISVLLESPLAAGIAMHGRAVLAMRSWRDFEADPNLSCSPVGGCCWGMSTPLFALPHEGRITRATVGEPGWRRAKLALLMPLIVTVWIHRLGVDENTAAVSVLMPCPTSARSPGSANRVARWPAIDRESSDCLTACAISSSER